MNLKYFWILLLLCPLCDSEYSIWSHGLWSQYYQFDPTSENRTFCWNPRISTNHQGIYYYYPHTSTYTTYIYEFTDNNGTIINITCDKDNGASWWIDVDGNNDTVMTQWNYNGLGTTPCLDSYSLSQHLPIGLNIVVQQIKMQLVTAYDQDDHSWKTAHNFIDYTLTCDEVGPTESPTQTTSIPTNIPTAMPTIISSDTSTHASLITTESDTTNMKDGITTTEEGGNDNSSNAKNGKNEDNTESTIMWGIIICIFVFGIIGGMIYLYYEIVIKKQRRKFNKNSKNVAIVDGSAASRSSANKANKGDPNQVSHIHCI